ncbi:MAG: TRAP transporter small permease [Pseudothermotoga sp.]
MKRIVKITADILETHIPALSMLILFMSMLLQVILRYGFKHPSPELFEISSYSFVWAVLLGAALANKYKNHIKFDIIYNKFSPRTKCIIDIVFDSFFSTLLVISLAPVIKQSLWYKIIRSEVLGIPWTYLVICLPIMMVLITVQNITSVYKNFRKLIKERTEKTEESQWH